MSRIPKIRSAAFTSFLLSLMSISSTAVGQSHLDIVRNTPCLAEYRNWFFTFRRSEVFVAPSEFTKEQCDSAGQIHAKIQTEQAEATKILADHPSNGDPEEQIVACLREYRIWKQNFAQSIDFDSAIKSFPPFLTYEPAQCHYARSHNAELDKRAALASEAEKRRMANRQKYLEQARRNEELTRLERIRVSKLPGVRIGMTASQVLNHSNWGKPLSVNRTTTASGTKEQWVYGEGNYLYFENGKLIAIQN